MQQVPQGVQPLRDLLLCEPVSRLRAAPIGPCHGCDCTRCVHPLARPVTCESRYASFYGKNWEMSKKLEIANQPRSGRIDGLRYSVINAEDP